MTAQFATLLQKSELSRRSIAISVVFLPLLMKTDDLSRKADYIGITGSVLCIIHCLVTPVLLVSSSLLQNSPLRAGYLSLDYIFIGINAVAVYFATRHVVSVSLKRSLWGFLAVFSIALVLEHTIPFFTYVAYAASAGLVISHLVNIRQHRLTHAH